MKMMMFMFKHKQLTQEDEDKDEGTILGLGLIREWRRGGFYGKREGNLALNYVGEG